MESALKSDLETVQKKPLYKKSRWVIFATGLYRDFDATVVKQKLGDNIVTVTNNVLHTFLKIFAVVKCLPCFPIIADTGTLIKNFRITKGTFLHEFCL